MSTHRQKVVPNRVTLLTIKRIPPGTYRRPIDACGPRRVQGGWGFYRGEKTL